jgi:hypothetical protein
MGRWLSITQGDGTKSDYAEIERQTPAGIETCAAEVHEASDRQFNRFWTVNKSRSPTHGSTATTSQEYFDTRAEARRSALRQCGRVMRWWK